MAAALAHHAVHREGQLAFDLGSGQRRLGAAAAALMGQPGVRSFDSLLATFDGDIHQAGSSMRVVRGSAASRSPAARITSKPRGKRPPLTRQRSGNPRPAHLP
jgi:hypothetical protein